MMWYPRPKEVFRAYSRRDGREYCDGKFGPLFCVSHQTSKDRKAARRVRAISAHPVGSYEPFLCLAVEDWRFEAVRL